MSNMQFDPSQALAALGGGGAPPGPDPSAPSAGASPDPLGGASVAPPASGDSSDTLKQIIDLFNLYMQEEQDPQELAVASDLQAKVHKMLSDSQKLTDQATGAGPGARVVRKATAAQQGGGGGSGY